MSWEQALNCPEADGPVEGDTHISTRIFLLGLRGRACGGLPFTRSDRALSPGSGGKWEAHLDLLSCSGSFPRLQEENPLVTPLSCHSPQD